MYLESGLKSATDFFTKLAFDEEVCLHDNLLIFFACSPFGFCISLLTTFPSCKHWLYVSSTKGTGITLFMNSH